MKNKIAIPKFSRQTIAGYHYNPLRNPDKVVLQVPNHDFSEAATFTLNLANAEDTKYFSASKEGLDLLEQIKMYGDIFYREGEIIIMEKEKNERKINRVDVVRLQPARRHHQVAKWAFAGSRKMSTLRFKKP